MKCLIIAAGKGSRLQLRGDSKPLIQVFGVPIIERVIRSVAKGGVSEFVVVTGYQHAQVDPFLADLSERLEVPITTALNMDWEKENGISVLKAKDHLQEPFLLSMADHIFDPETVRAIMDHPLGEGEIALMVDRNLENESVNMDDVTRVKIEDGKIVDLGKGLEDYNAFDTGIFKCTPALFDAIEKSSSENGDTSLSGGVRILASEGRVHAVDFKGRFWVDVDDPAAIREAENALLENLPESIVDTSPSSH